MEQEQLYIASELRVRASGSNGTNLSGLIPYYSRSHDLGGFTEQIAPGAFSGALKAGADVLAFRDHNSQILLGRTKAGTLHLNDTADGLAYTINLPNTTQANDLAESVRRGDLDGCSFGFSVPDGGDTWIAEGARALRTLKKVDLAEISPCTNPAYPATQVSLRSCPAAIRAHITLGQPGTVIPPAMPAEESTEEWKARAWAKMRLAQQRSRLLEVGTPDSLTLLSELQRMAGGESDVDDKLTDSQWNARMQERLRGAKLFERSNLTRHSPAIADILKAFHKTPKEKAHFAK